MKHLFFVFFSGLGLLGLLFSGSSRDFGIISLGGSGVDELRRVGRDQADQALRSQIGDGLAGKRTVDTQSIDEDRGSDELVGRDFLEQTFFGVLVKDDGVVGLILGLSLGPLLLCLSSSSL